MGNGGSVDFGRSRLVHQHINVYEILLNTLMKLITKNLKPITVILILCLEAVPRACLT